MSRDQELEIARLAGELEGTAKARFEEYEKQIAELERQLADVGSINLRLMEKLAELREAANERPRIQ